MPLLGFAKCVLFRRQADTPIERTLRKYIYIAELPSVKRAFGIFKTQMHKIPPRFYYTIRGPKDHSCLRFYLDSRRDVDFIN